MKVLETNTQQAAKLMCKNLQVLRTKFPLESSRAVEICALMGALQNEELSAEEISASRERIRQNAVGAGKIPGAQQLILATTLSMVPDMAKTLEQTLRLYRILREEAFCGRYLLAVSLWLAASPELAAADWSPQKARSIADYLVKQHSFPMQGEEECYAIFLSCCQKGAEQLCTTMEQHYSFWRKKIYSPLAVLCLSSSITSLDAPYLAETEEHISWIARSGEGAAIRFLLAGDSVIEARQQLKLAVQILKKERTLRGIFCKKYRDAYAAALAAKAVWEQKRLTTPQPNVKIAFSIAFMELLPLAEAGR